MKMIALDLDGLRTFHAKNAETYAKQIETQKYIKSVEQTETALQFLDGNENVVGEIPIATDVEIQSMLDEILGGNKNDD